MAATYTTGFSLEKIGSGEQAGTWGTTSNHNWDIVDRLASYKAVALSDASTATLTVREASPGSGTENLQDGMYRAIKFTGSLSQDCTVTIAPNTAPAWFIIENAAGDDVILSQGSGANVTVQNGKNVIVYCDGAGGGAAVVDALADLQIGTLEVTGAAAIDGALTQAGASQFNSTITVGVDDTGYDVKFFGATSGAYMLWDESADDLKLVGAAGLTVAGDIDVDGTTNLDVVDVDGAVNFAADVTFADGADIITASAGTSNFRAGVNAGNSIASGGNYNVAVGDEAGTAISTGDNNVCLGYAAGAALNTASSNTIIGHTAGDAATTASPFIAIGHAAGGAVTTGNGNLLVGQNAGDGMTEATNNTAFGHYTLRGSGGTTASAITAIGYNAGNSHTSGTGSTYLGSYCGDANTTGGTNTFIGDASGTANITGSGNTFVGQAAGAGCTTGGDNVAIGANALDALTTVGQLVAIGKHALGSLTTSGSGNNAVGYNAGGKTTGTDNTYLGHNSGSAITGGANNVSIGSGSMSQTSATANTGNHNVAVGYQALKATTTAQFNIGIGKDAGLAVTTGSGNTLIGYHAADVLTTGGANTALGRNALGALETSSDNTALGAHAGASITTGGGNTFVGQAAGDVCITGATNAALGQGAAGALTTASSCVFVGLNAGSNLTTGGGGNSIYLGSSSQASAADVGGHEVVIGPGTAKGVNSAFVVAGGSVYKGDNGTAWAQTSDRRIKKDIQPNTKGLAEICQVDPKTFLYKSDEELHEIPEFEGCAEGLPQDKRVTSAIAQEVQVPFPEAVTERNDYGMLTVNTDPIFWAMINSIKELSTEIDELKKWKEEHTCCG